MSTQRIVVILPCYNEEVTLGKVIDDFRRALPEAELVVYDNNSTDRSAEIARERGVRVRHVHRQGKGHVIRAAFDELDADIYVMVDTDDTYPAEEVEKLIIPVARGEADVVIGNRLATANQKTLRPLHQFGNWVFLQVINFTFRTRLRDVLSGYRVMNRDYVDQVTLLSGGYEIETELSLQALEKHFTVQEIPITYRERPAGSHSKLHSFRDGWRIILTIFGLLRDYRPMTFFSAVGAVFLVLGLAFGWLVVLDYLDNHLVERMPSVVLSSLLIIMAAVSLLAGLLLSAINRRFAEMEVLIRRRSPQRQSNRQ